MKRNLFLILLSYIGLTLSSCKATSTLNSYKGETLIVSAYKVIEHGHFVFLVFMNEVEVKKIVYSYFLDVKNNKITCLKDGEEVYNIHDKSDYLGDYQFQTAEEFARSQHNTWREKYYKCFTDNFLDKTNDEKIDLLNKLTKE